MAFELVEQFAGEVPDVAIYPTQFGPGNRIVDAGRAGINVPMNAFAKTYANG
jgi:hypothetical protein